MFDSYYHLKKHNKEQHQGKVVKSPERKSPRTEPKEEENFSKSVIDKETDNIEKGDMDTDTVSEDVKEMQNLQDLLVQTGQENKHLKSEMRIMLQSKENMNDKLIQLEQEEEQLKIDINPWMEYKENMNGKLNKAEYEKRELTKEVSDMKAVLNTPVLGLAIPLLKGANILSYDCSLCAQRDMNQNGIAHHLKEKHNVDRKLDILPVEGNNDEEQRFVVSTDTMEPPETPPAMGPETAPVRPPENLPEMAPNATSPPVRSQDLSSPPAPVQEQTTTRTETQERNGGTQ